MRKILFFMAMTALLSALSCQNKKEGAATDADSLTTAAVATDSTLVGVSGEFGQSTFSLITEKGDTLELLRERADGELSSIAGDIEADTRYAITYTQKDGELYLLTAINLSQVDALTKDYTLANGALVLQGDTVSISELTDSTLIAKGRSGKDYQLKK